MAGKAHILRPSLPFALSSTIYFDIVSKETHEGAADITEHPVETGPDVADHIRAKLASLTLEAMVTNTPIEDPFTLGGAEGALGFMAPVVVTYETPFSFPIAGFPGAVNIAQAIGLAPKNTTNTALVIALQFSSAFDRVTNVFNALMAIRETGELVDVATPLKYYENMAIASISAPRENATGGSAIMFTIEFRGIRVVTTDTISLPAVEAKKAKGIQETKAASGEQEKKGLKSVLAAGQDALAK